LQNLVGLTGPDFEVQVNTGTSYAPIWSGNLDLGRYGRDGLIGNGGDKEVLYQRIAGAPDRLWFDDSVAPPHSTDASFRIYGRIAHKFRAMFWDEAAYARLGEHYEVVLYDEKVMDQDAAMRRAREIIRLRSRPLETLTMTVDVDVDHQSTRLRVGDLLHVQNTFYGIDTYGGGQQGYRVQDIESWMSPHGNLIHHKLIVGTYQQKLTDKIKWLSRRAEQQMSDYEDDEEELYGLLLGAEGTEQDATDVVLVGDTVGIAPT
jgi:hypothetical protein